MKKEPSMGFRTTCTYCKKPMHIPHVDDHHRFTPLCGRCYSDDSRWKATSYPADNPDSWWYKEPVATPA